MLDKGAEAIRQAKEERRNTKINKTRIIVMGNSIMYCEFVCSLLAWEGFRTVQTCHPSTARKPPQQAPNGSIMVSDLRLSGDDGTDLLRWARREGMTQPLIIMTNYAEMRTAVEGMKLSSLDYVPKQFVENKLMPLFHIILKRWSIGRNRMPVSARDSSAFQEIMQQVRLIAPVNTSVLILGENDTGKGHITHHLHGGSKRVGKPFVPVDYGPLSKDPVPSAFFGYAKGTFTGADGTKRGYFNEAGGDTLFLDEVGNLALEAQQMLLRVIQEWGYRPIGDRADKSFNICIIAVTSEDLEKAVIEKRFRQDLLHRLYNFEITVPPSRDCQGDIMLSAEFFREVANNELGCSMTGFDAEVRKTLLTHPQPGNVREFRQKIVGAVLQVQTGVVMKECLEPAITKPTLPVSFALRNDARDKERILRALKQANGNRKIAAELLGVGRITLHSELERYGLKYKLQQSQPVTYRKQK